jgi:long-chain fatty acid transport protein
MKSIHKLSFLLTTSLLLAFAGTASATNGYFTHGSGTKNKGMAGAGIAGASDSISIANNPASAVFAIGKLDVGAALFSPIRSYSTTTSVYNGAGTAFTIGPNDLDSGREYFVIPHVAYTWGIGENSALGLAFYGRGGMNSKWGGGTASFTNPQTGTVVTPPGTFGAGTAGVDLSQAFLDVAFASKLGDKFAWGVALVGVLQSFEAYGVGTFAPFTQTFAESGGTAFPDSLSGNGHEFSTGIGAKIGIDWALTDNLIIAASYQTEIDMSELETYSDLFAEGGDFDIPADIKVGITWRTGNGFSISLDAEQILYSEIGSVGNPFANIFTCPTVNPASTDFSGCLGGSNGAGFGWEDMTVYKAGAEWTPNGSDWTWRGGVSTGDAPIPDTEIMFNILAPATIEDHVALGFTKQMSETSELNFSFMYALENKIVGPNFFDFNQLAPPVGPPQDIEIRMHQYEFEVSYSWRF